MGYPGELLADTLDIYVTYTLGIEPVGTKSTLA